MGVYDLHAETPLYRLRGRTPGILGFGADRQDARSEGLGFGLHVIAYNPLFQKSAEFADVEAVGFEDLLRRSDYISIHVPSTPETCHVFNRDAFRLMKPSSVLINTARRDILDEDALLWALDSNEIAGTALDVLTTEPPDPAML